MDIEKLKQKILDLAIRGKLVPQDPNDEPASVLIEKIRKEKEELIKQGKIKRDKNESYIYKGSDNCYYEKIGNDIKNITDELPFEIPNSWAWVRLNNLCNIKGGKRIPKGMSFSKIPTNHIYIRVSDMIDESISKEKLVYIDEDVFQYIKQYVISKDDLYVSIAGTIGKCGIVPAFFDNMNLTENAVKLTNILYNKLWLLIILTSNYGKEKMVEKVHQVAQPKLSITSLSDVLIPIPPLNESEKIILYFNSYRKHISRIDCWKNEINGLIQKLKTKILEYYFGEDSCYKSYYSYNVEKLINIARVITKGSTPTTYGFKYLDEGISFIKVENVKNGIIDHNTINQYISQEAHDFQKRSQLEENDILFSIAGTIGRTCIVTKNDLPANTNQALAIIRGYDSKIIPEYLELYLNWYVYKKTNLAGHGAGMLNVTLNDLKNLAISYPINKNTQKLVVDKIINIKNKFEMIS